MSFLWLVIVLILPYSDTAPTTYHEVLRMPLSSFVGPNKVEYGCLSVPLKAEEYIVDFQPHSPPGGVHHMSVYTCDEPYETEHIWECIDPTHICKPGSHKGALFAWNLGAPGWTLPSFTGIYTGNRSRHIVLQVHGRTDLKSYHLDKYGSIDLGLRSDRPQFDTVLKVYGVGGYIPANTLGFTTDVACTWDTDFNVQIIAYATHTHDYGNATSAYIIRNGTWIEIGRVDPKYSMLTYDISYKRMFVQPGDVVALRCTYNNHGATNVHFGFSHSEEMCNLLLYFTVPHSYAVQTKMTMCSNNAQDYRWEDEFDNIPALASDVSGDTDQNRYMKTHYVPIKI